MTPDNMDIKPLPKKLPETVSVEDPDGFPVEPLKATLVEPPDMSPMEPSELGSMQPLGICISVSL